MRDRRLHWRRPAGQTRRFGARECPAACRRGDRQGAREYAVRLAPGPPRRCAQARARRAGRQRAWSSQAPQRLRLFVAQVVEVGRVTVTFDEEVADGCTPIPTGRGVVDPEAVEPSHQLATQRSFAPVISRRSDIRRSSGHGIGAAHCAMEALGRRLRLPEGVGQADGDGMGRLLGGRGRVESSSSFVVYSGSPRARTWSGVSAAPRA